MASGEFTNVILAPCKYEYLDHKAGEQLHAWGDSLKEAFEQCGMSMFAYMTSDLDSVEIKQNDLIEADGHDIDSLLFKFLDKLLFLFSCDPFMICRKLEITEFVAEGDQFRITCKCYGEEFQIDKHPGGKEIKAITYCSM